MKVLLTGATGFVGKHLLKQLRDQGIYTIALGRTKPEGLPEKQYIQCDLLDLNQIDDAVSRSGATHLIHLAWYAEHGEYWSSSLNLRWLESSLRLVESFCKSGGEKVVIAGTCAEYDWTYGYCIENTTPANPSTLYGVAKNATRQLTEAICEKYEVNWAWGRIFIPYGDGEDGRRLIPSLIAVFQGRKDPFGVNGAVYRDFIHVVDLANCFISLLQSEARGVFNTCTGRPVMISDIVCSIAKRFDADFNIILGLTTARPGEPEMLIGSSEKIIEIGWNGNTAQKIEQYIDKLTNLKFKGK